MQPESCFIPVAYFILDHLRERKSWCPCNWEYKALGGIVYLSPNLHRIQFWKRPAIPTEELLALSLIISLYMKHSLPSSFRQGIFGVISFWLWCLLSAFSGPCLLAAKIKPSSVVTIQGLVDEVPQAQRLCVQLNTSRSRLRGGNLNWGNISKRLGCRQAWRAFS